MVGDSCLDPVRVHLFGVHVHMCVMFICDDVNVPTYDIDTVSRHSSTETKMANPSSVAYAIS